MVPMSYTTTSYTVWSACNWTANNANTNDQINVGSVSSPGECIALVQSYCPDADIANIDKDGDGDCYCQELAVESDANLLPDTGGRRQSCLLATVEDFWVNCYLGSSAVTCTKSEYLDDEVGSCEECHPGTYQDEPVHTQRTCKVCGRCLDVSKFRDSYFNVTGETISDFNVTGGYSWEQENLDKRDFLMHLKVAEEDWDKQYNTFICLADSGLCRCAGLYDQADDCKTEKDATISYIAGFITLFIALYAILVCICFRSEMRFSKALRTGGRLSCDV